MDKDYYMAGGLLILPAGNLPDPELSGEMQQQIQGQGSRKHARPPSLSLVWGGGIISGLS